MECTKCGHDPSTVKADPLQMLLAASMMVQRLRQLANNMIMCCAICDASGKNINTILNEFATDSKGSTNQIERK